MIHVVPVGDLYEHRCDRECWCAPDIDDQGDQVIVIHHSADGRELFESGERWPS